MIFLLIISLLFCSVQSQSLGGRYLIAHPQNLNFGGQLFQLPYASRINENEATATSENPQLLEGQRHRREETPESEATSEAKSGLRLLSPSQPQKRENGQLAAFSPSQIGEGAVSQTDYDTNQYSFDPFEAALTTVDVPRNQSITRDYQVMTSSSKADLTANFPAAYPTRVPAAQQSDKNSQLSYGQDPVNEVAIGEAITKMIVDRTKNGPKNETIATIDPVDAAYTTQVTSTQEIVKQTVRRTMPPAVEPNPESLNKVTENFEKTKNMDEKIIHNSYNITNITIINNYRRSCGNAKNSRKSCKPTTINRVVTNSNRSNPTTTSTSVSDASHSRRHQIIDAQNRNNLPIFEERRKEEKQSAPTENTVYTENIHVSPGVEDNPRNRFTNASSINGENHLMNHSVGATLGKQDPRATATVPFSTTVVNSPDLSTNSTVSQTSAPPQLPEMNFSSSSPATYALPPQNSFGSNQFGSSFPAAYPTQVSSFFGVQPSHQQYQIPYPNAYPNANQYPNNDIIGAPIGFPLPHMIIPAEAQNRIPISAVGNVDKKVGEIEFEAESTVDGNTVNTTVHHSNTDILQSNASVTDFPDPEPSKVPERNSSITFSESTVPGVATALPQRTVSTGVGTVSPPSSTAEIPTPTANGTVTDVTVHHVHEPVIISSLKSRKKRIDKEEESGKSISRRFVVQAVKDFVSNAKSSKVGKPGTELKTENSEKKPNDVNTLNLNLALDNQPTLPPPVTTVAPSIDISADQLPEDARLALKGYVDYPVYNSKKYVRPENPLLRANIIQQLPPTPPPPPPPPPSSFPPLHPALSNLPPAVLSLLRERMEQLQMLAMLQYQQQLIRGQAPARLSFFPPALPYNPYSQLLASQQQNAQQQPQLQQQQHQQQQFSFPQGRPYLAIDTRQQGESGTPNWPQPSDGIPQNIAPPTTFFSPQQSPNAPPGAFPQNQNLVEQRRLRSIDERNIDRNQPIQSQQPMATYTIGGRVLQIPILYRRQTEGK